MHLTAHLHHLSLAGIPSHNVAIFSTKLSFVRTFDGGHNEFLKSILCMGLFGWLGLAVITGTFPGGDGGSSKTRAIKNMIAHATDQFGVMQTGIGLIGFGFMLGLFFMMLHIRGLRAEE